MSRLDDPDENGALKGEKIERLLKKIRKQGYATSDQEQGKSIRAVAVPVLLGDRVACSFNVIVPAQVMSMEQAVTDYVPLISSAAREIEQRIQG